MTQTETPTEEYVRPSKEELLAVLQYSMGKRRGVNAGRKIFAGEIIERSPVVIIPGADLQIVAETDLAPYLEPWPWKEWAAAFPLGFAAMYNDSAEPNTDILRYPDEMIMEIVAAVDIEEGEEMTVPRRWRINGWTPEQAQEATSATPAAPNSQGDG